MRKSYNKEKGEMNPFAGTVTLKVMPERIERAATLRFLRELDAECPLNVRAEFEALKAERLRRFVLSGGESW